MKMKIQTITGVSTAFMVFLSLAFLTTMIDQHHRWNELKAMKMDIEEKEREIATRFPDGGARLEYRELEDGITHHLYVQSRDESCGIWVSPYNTTYYIDGRMVEKITYGTRTGQPH